MSGSPIRQDYLEKAIKWINDEDFEDYMATHQHGGLPAVMELAEQGVLVTVLSPAATEVGLAP